MKLSPNHSKLFNISLSSILLDFTIEFPACLQLKTSDCIKNKNWKLRFFSKEEKYAECSQTKKYVLFKDFVF